MSVNWNLDVLYKGFEDPKFLKDLSDFDGKITNFSDTVSNLISSREILVETLTQYLNSLIEIYTASQRLGAFLSLTLSVDSTNVLANKYKVQLGAKASKLTEPTTKMDEFINSIENIDAVLAQSDFLTEHKFFFKEIIRQNDYMLSVGEESIISKLKNTGSSAWVNYKNKLISTHKVNIILDGESKQLPLTEVLNLVDSPDATVRKTAYEAEIKSYVTIEEGVAAALNAIKGEVLTEVEARGYDSVIQMTLEESRMDDKTLNAMLEAMKESMPIFRKYLRRKAELLGHKNGLPWYDIYAPIIKKEMSFSYEQGKEFVVKNFRTFSDKLADFAQYAMDNDWIDVYPKPGKVGGAFCSGLAVVKECRILLNYGNTIGDVSTFAHELGHGFHNLCLNNESYLNRSYPMPLAETASILCETIVKKAAVKEAPEDEKIAIIEAEICGATQVIVDIYSRYLFEHAFFEARKEGYVSVEQIKELMLNAQKEAYGEGLDENVLHPYMWTWKSHYYYPSRNFYNFPYAFGLLFAKGLYAKYLEDKTNFPNRYEELLAVTGKLSIEEVALSIGINVAQKDFWQASLQTIVDDINEFLELTNKK
ncbi:oligoendopeptidase F [Candidatus Epulonipiscioides gigas]|nr:oligoendopeptidase F [Epulopiscium sp. SCG-C07WGA-EpuloA2]